MPSKAEKPKVYQSILHSLLNLVSRKGVEPSCFTAADFKSAVSTNFTTRTNLLADFQQLFDGTIFLSVARKPGEVFQSLVALVIVLP